MVAKVDSGMHIGCETGLTVVLAEVLNTYD